MSEDGLLPLTKKFRQKIEMRLDRLVPPPDRAPSELHRSMRHTLLAPGKRVRAILTLLAARHMRGDEECAMSSACALEMVHAASLILDDLPAMDNASLRRGLPANHQVFGEATAILAAIALLNRAFGVIAEDRGLTAGQCAQLTEILSRSIGSEGLVAGQEQDLKWSASEASEEGVTLVHARKTGALFSAAAEMGAVTASADEKQIAPMRDFGMKLGLAFQILDDLVDATADKGRAGKDVLQDENRPSLVRTIGQEAANREAQTLIQEASRLIADGSRDESALRHFAMWLVASFENKIKSASLGD